MLFGLHAKEITNRCSGSPPPHHCQGYLKRQIFENNADRDSFLARLGGILKETETGCYAWALRVRAGVRDVHESGTSINK